MKTTQSGRSSSFLVLTRLGIGVTIDKKKTHLRVVPIPAGARLRKKVISMALRIIPGTEKPDISTWVKMEPTPVQVTDEEMIAAANAYRRFFLTPYTYRKDTT